MTHSPTLVDDRLCVLAKRTGTPGYDFDFELFLPCSHPTILNTMQTTVARIGAIGDYDSFFSECMAGNLQLINTFEEHRRASLISQWYPLLEGISPKTVVWDERPTLAEVEEHFSLPVFVRGERQTSRHQAALSIIRTADGFEACMDAYAADPILHWQRIAVREFIPLRPVPGKIGSTVPPSFEFRTFWWRARNVGIGRYWVDCPEYQATESELAIALGIAGDAAARVSVPFVVVDVAMSEQGRWLVIECNDAQESGYSGIAALPMWRRILDIESSRSLKKSS